MASNTTAVGGPVFEKDPLVKAVEFANADAAATKKDLVSGSGDIPAEGSRIDQITLASTDTVSRVFRFYEHDGTSSFLIGAVSVAALAGTDGATALVDAMLTLAPTLGYLILPSGHKLQVDNVAQLTAAKVVDVVARGGKLTA